MTDTKHPATITLTDLDELERLEREATGGDWYRTGPLTEEESLRNGGVPVGIGYLCSDDDGTGVVDLIEDLKESDADLIVTARNNLPRLLALAKIGMLAITENEAQKAVPRGPVVEGMDLTTTQAWMLASEKLDAAIDAYREKPK